MKSSLLRKLPFILILFAIICPYFVFAQSLPNVWSPASLKGPIVVCTGAGPVEGSLGRNCQNLCDLVFQFATIVYLLIAAVIWVIAPIAFVTGGIMYMFAGANPGLASTARKALTGTVIGVVIVLCAYIIIATFLHFLGIGGVGGFNGASICQPPH